MDLGAWRNGGNGTRRMDGRAAPWEWYIGYTEAVLRKVPHETHLTKTCSYFFLESVGELCNSETNSKLRGNVSYIYPVHCASINSARSNLQ